jgi:hypothetical protein
MLRLALLVCALLWFAIPVVSAYDAASNPAAANLDDEDEEVKKITKVQEEAAEYRMARDRYKPDAVYEAEAKEYLTEAQAIAATGKSQPLEGWYYWMFSANRRTRWLAMDGFKERGYAACAGDLVATAIESHARSGDIDGLYSRLVMLWYYLPDYPHLQRLMETAQAAAERVQNFEASINLDASDPGKVISVDSDGLLSDVIRLFRFQALHGDRETVAPRAELGLARALMISKGPREISAARRQYEHFLEVYPNHPLTFHALCEQALCYLVTYQGKDYDVGVLISAAAVIDQAEIEARGDSEKLRKVEAYRKRIRLWHQDRDLMVAQWYADRVPPYLAFLMRPGEGPDSWNRGARYYFQAVIKRDSASPQGREAARDLDRLPPAPPDVLTLPAPKK